MKKKVVLVFLAVLVAKSYSDNKGNCEFQDNINFETNMFVNEAVNDSIGLNKSFNFIGSMGIGTITGDTAYIQVTTEDGTDGGALIFRTNDNFTSIFEENTPKRSGTATISVNVELKCSAGSSFLNFIQPVIDTNNHDPVFGKPTYDYLMPMPMVPKIDLTSLGEPIVVTDVDFTNQNIEFTVDDDDFQVITAPVDDSKNYRSILSVTTFKRLTENKTITITATDDGSPPRSTTAQINITIDPNAILPDIPKFSKAKYKFTYSDTDGDITLTPDPEDPIIKVDTTNVQKTEVKLEINPYFEAKYDKQTGEVIISPNGTSITSSLNNVMVLELTAILDDLSSVAIILIDIPPEKVVSTPTFTRVYYTATYNASSTPHTVTLDDGQTIAIHEQEDVTISLVDDEHHFSIQNVGEKWTLTIDKELDNDTLDIGEEKRLTLAATVNENVTDGAATLIVKLPEVPVTISPTFSRVFYTADYIPATDDTKASVQLNDGPINITNTGEYDLKPLESTNFELEKGTDGTWTLQVKSNDDLNYGSVYKFVLETVVSDSTEQAGFATLIIAVPEREVPKFQQPYYTAQYVVTDGIASVSLTDGPIALTSGGNVNVVIKPDDNSENFEFECDPATGTCQLSVTTELPASVLSQGDDVVLILEATSSDDNTSTTSTVVIISLPDTQPDVAPRFTRAYYRGKYVVDETGTAQVQMIGGNVHIRSPTDEQVSVNFAEVTDNFNITVDPNDPLSWILTVTNKLDDDAIQKGDDKYFTLQARTDGGNPLNVGNAVLIIEVDPDKVPLFTQAYYEAGYSVNAGIASVTLSVPVELDPSGSGDVQFVGTYAEYFTFALDSDPQITVVRELENNITRDNSEILLTLQVSLPTSPDLETSVVELKLPHQESSDSLRFKEPSYVFSYTVESGTASLDGPNIELTSSVPEVTFKLTGNHNENFVITNNGDGTYRIELNGPLGESVIDTESDILLVLDASATDFDDGFTAVLINLPKKASETLPSFVRSIYVGVYAVGTENEIDTVDLEDITVWNEVDGETISLAGTHAENFAVVPNTDSSGYTVQVKTNLNGDTLSKEVDIVLTLQLSTDDINNANVATLVIQLPKQAAPAAFSQAFYLAKYQLGSPQDTVQVSEPIELTGDNADSTTVQLEGELSENFRISDSSPYVLTLEQNIDPSTLAAQREIVITLVASLDDSTITFKSSIIINTPSAASDIVPKFSRLYYYGSYNNDDPNMVTIKPITIVSDRSPDTKVAVDGDYSEYFEAAQNVDGTWTLNVVKPLSDDDLNAQNEIIVNLIATLNEAKDTGRAIAIIDLHTDGDLKPSPTFTSPKYTAKYEVDISGVASVEYVDGPIKIPYVADAVDLTLDNSNFDLNYNDITDQWDLTIVTPLSPELFKTTAELIVVISSHMGNHVDGAATLVIQLPGREEIEFDKPYYEATYKVNDEGMDSVVIPQDIGVADGVQVAFQENFGDHFDIQPSSSNTWQLSVKSDLSETDLSTKSKILLVVEATKPDTSSNSSATIVVSLPLQEQLQAPQFDQPLYQTNYLEDKGAIKSVPVSILGVTDVNEVTVEVDGDNKELFIVTPDGDHWELTSKNLPTSITDNEVSIVFTLKATKTGVAASGLANVVVDLPKKTASSEFHFDRNVYVAQYTIDNAVTVEPIVIDGLTGSVELSIEGNYSSSFDVKNEDENVVVSVSQPLESDVLNDKITLSLIIRAKQGADEAVTTLIVELPKTRDSNSLVFSNTVYTALYDVNGDSLDTITLENGPIQINDVSDLDNIDIQIDGDYKNNFDVVADGSGWTVKVQNNLQPNVVLDNISVLLTITATAVDDNSKSGQTSLVIQFRQQSVSEFQFKSSAYMADYEVEKSKPSIKVEKTIIVTGETDSVKLTGDYSQYFEPSSSPTVNETTISISTTDKVIPDEIYKKSAISLQLEATKGNEVATATLVVTLPRPSDGDDDNQNDDDDDDGDDTALIIAVAILAVLLVASIVGSGVFYYLKFRRGTDNYSNMDEDVPRVSERFRKNSNSVDAKHKFDHPARRPTGITKYPLGENVGGETNTDEEPIEKRKSVQFDVINIEEREIEPEKLEEDVDEGNNYDAPAIQDDNAYENLNNEHSNETSTDDIKFNL